MNGIELLAQRRETRDGMIPQQSLDALGQALALHECGARGTIDADD